MIRRWRFAAEHVQAGAAQVARTQGIGQRRFINQATPGGVDQKGAGLHLRDKGRIHQLVGLRRQRAMQAEHIRLRQQLRQRHPPGLAAMTLEGFRHQYLHAQRLGQPGHFPAQIAVANQPQGLAGQLHDRVIQQTELGRPAPGTGLHIPVVLMPAGGQ